MLDKKVTIAGRAISGRVLAFAAGAVALVIIIYLLLSNFSLGALFVPNGAKLAVQEYIAQELPPNASGFTVQSDGWKVTSGEKAPDAQNLSETYGGQYSPFQGAVDEAWCVTIAPAIIAQNNGANYLNTSVSITGFVVARQGDNWAVAWNAGSQNPTQLTGFDQVGCSGENVAPLE